MLGIFIGEFVYRLRLSDFNFFFNFYFILFGLGDKISGKKKGNENRQVICQVQREEDKEAKSWGSCFVGLV